METPEGAASPAPAAAGSTDATKSAVTSTAKTKTSDGYGYKAYKRKKKEGELYKKEKMTRKEIITEVLHWLTMFIMFTALVIWAKCIMAEAEHMSQSKHTSVIDRPATTITGKKFVIVSNNEYCNYIIEEVMERGFTAATAGRVMFMCMYATTPHLISPHAEQMYITVDEHGNVTDSIVNQQDRPDDFLDNLLGTAGSMQQTGRYSIGLSKSVVFQKRLFKMANDHINSAAAMKILLLRTKEFQKIPINHDLHVTLRKHKFEIDPLKCPQYFTSWGTMRVNGEYVDQSYMMRYFIGEQSLRCYNGNDTECIGIQEEFYKSMSSIYTIHNRKNYGNPFEGHNASAEFLNDEKLNTTNVEHTNFALGDLKIMLPNFAGAEFEIKQKNEKLKKAFEKYGAGDHLNLPRMLIDIINGTVPGYQESAMTGFIIIDSQKRISIGAGGLNEPGGSRICHQGMFLDNNNRLDPMFEQSYKYRHRFFPIFVMNPKTNKIKITLILATNHYHAVQTVTNFIYKAVENKKTKSPVNDEKDTYGDVVRIPILVATGDRNISFIRGLPYSHVRDYQRREPNITFVEAEWDQFKMDVLGATIRSTQLRGYYIDQDGEFAAMAAQ